MLLTSPTWWLKWPSWRSVVILEMPGQKCGNILVLINCMTKVICRLCRSNTPTKVCGTCVLLILCQSHLNCCNVIMTMKNSLTFSLPSRPDPAAKKCAIIPKPAVTGRWNSLCFDTLSPPRNAWNSKQKVSHCFRHFGQSYYSYCA